ncbi:MAG TPA: hydantoinase B/oxoprolinase family protein [Stellaceae bacterium]|nr:hydantoinase B/oxoprolinase family protein [Stellaceae bacterium]
MDGRAAGKREQQVDAVTLQLVKGALRSAQLEMETLLSRTAMSPFIREKKDFFCALFDEAARLVVGTAIPIFGDLVGPVLAHYPAAEMRPGDLYWYNDCYGSKGAVSHSPDQVFIAPVFAEGLLSGFAQSWAHFNDIGGLRPGSLSPDATDIFQEGIIVPPIRLARDGVIDTEVMRVFTRNSRFPAMVTGDIRAATAAVRLGERRMGELFQRFGRATVLAAFAAAIDETRRIVRDWLRRTIPPGRYDFTERIDRDGHGNGPFAIRMRLEVDERGATLDARETDDQAPGPINFIMSPEVPRLAFGIYALARERSVLLNQGALDAVDAVRVRPGSLLQPNFPAPLGQRGITLIRVGTACLGLVNVATQGAAVAAHNVYVIAYLRGRTVEGEAFLLTDGIAVGYGGRSDADGIDAVYLIANENYPAEFLDLSYPVRLRRYAINPDSGGPGRWRGGCGVIRELEVLAAEAMLSIRIDSVDNPPWGVAGGRSGRGGCCILNPGRETERHLPPLGDGILLHRGDVLRIETGGGGGWGHPFDREPERVLADIRGGFVTAERARADYGVALGADGCSIDAAETARLRHQRGDAKLFHRGAYFEALP